MHTDPERWLRLVYGVAFFRECLQANAPLIAVENPIPHKYAVGMIGRKYDCKIQPYQFGHAESKATCFWTNGLPPLVPTNVVSDFRHAERRIHNMSPSPNRWKERSRTLPGIAAAMADQWGSL